MIHEQGSAGWHSERFGRITASQMNCVMAGDGAEPYKTGLRKGLPRDLPMEHTNYVRRLAAERITGKSRDPIKAKALDWGHDVEPIARAYYEARTGVLVELCGFILHPDYPFIGASPDFLIGKKGGGEIKCPESTEVHLATLEDGLPEEHINQIQGGLFVTGRDLWDFVSFHPAFPAPLNLYVQRVTRDDIYIKKLEAACIRVENSVTDIVMRQMAKTTQLEAA